MRYVIAFALILVAGMAFAKVRRPLVSASSRAETFSP
jgi:hypothetical protein